jgi:hypothetical protein
MDPTKEYDTFNCGTGCRGPAHLVKCLVCGAEYHVGLVHFCSIDPHYSSLGVQVINP